MVPSYPVVPWYHGTPSGSTSEKLFSWTWLATSHTFPIVGVLFEGSRLGFWLDIKYLRVDFKDWWVRIGTGVQDLGMGAQDLGTRVQD